MPNTEDIEARLCAYVDGELDEAGRGEIERHLAANPQHRKLIDELIEQRDLLRALPRVRAPHDVAETLNAQLERAALLNEEDDWRDQPIRLSRWPQIRAAAAVLLLVFGLAAVVYYVVPSPNRSNNSVVFNAPPGVDRPRMVDAEASPPTTRPDVIADSVVTVGEGKPDHEFMASSEQQRRALASLFPEPLNTPISNAASPQLDILRNAFGSSEPKRAAVTVVVAAADADAAQRRVRDYFNERGVELEPQPQFAQAPMPQPLSIDPSQRALGSRQQQPTRIKMREKQSDDGGAAALAQTPDVLTEKDAAAAPPAPAEGAGQADEIDAAPPDRVAAPRDGGYEPLPEQRFMTRLPRREVAELSRDISNQLAGRTVQVLEGTAAGTSDRSEASDFSADDMGNWTSLFPWIASSRADAAADERRFAFTGPTTRPESDEEVDVLIVVRSDPALQLQQAQQALTDSPAIAEREFHPATAPATAPSSP